MRSAASISRSPAGSGRAARPVRQRQDRRCSTSWAGSTMPPAAGCSSRDLELTGLDDRGLTAYRRRHVGFVFQFYNLIPSLTAYENVALVTEIARRPMRPDEALALVGLEARMDHFPAQLSGGEQQRVAIARAIAKRPGGAAVRRADRRARLQDRHPRDRGAARASTGSSAPRRSSSRTMPASRTSPIGCCSSPTAGSRGSSKNETRRAAARAQLVTPCGARPQAVARPQAALGAGARHRAGDRRRRRHARAGGRSHRSLDETRTAYYERYRFADVFAHGEARAEGAGRPDRRHPRRRRRRGAHRQARAARHSRTFASRPPGSSFRCRTPASPCSIGSTCGPAGCPSPGRADEVVVNESFAKAHGFAPGSRLLGDPERPEARARHRRHRALAGVHLCGRARRPHAGRSPLRRSSGCPRRRSPAPTISMARSRRSPQAAARRFRARGHQRGSMRCSTATAGRRHTAARIRPRTPCSTTSSTCSTT